MPKLFNIIFLTVILFSCQYAGKNNEPIRKTGIPKNAFWVGGIDGGNWYLIDSMHRHENNISIKIYNDQTGELILSKTFVLVCPESKQRSLENLQKRINSFDGEKITLESHNGEKNCWLQ